MADREYDRRDYDPQWDPNRDWDQGYNRSGYYPDWDQSSNREWDRGSSRRMIRSHDLSMHPEYYDRDWDQGYNRSGFNPDWNQGYNRSGYNRSSFGSRRQDRSSGSDYESNWDTNSYPTWTYVEYWWIVPGPYSGVGPQGYQRSDERIMEDVCERMTQHGQIDPSDIHIDVNNGEVTLQGNVNSRREKRIAEDIAESVTGVSDVHNRLRIQGGSQAGASSRGSFSGTSGAMSGMGSQIREDMEVIGKDGQHIGKVKKVRSNDFLVDREMARDIYIPFSACQLMQGRVQLNLNVDQVESQGWEMPDLVQTPGTGNQGSNR